MIPPPAGGGAHRKHTAYVYLLRSCADGTCYVGWTTDVLRRLAEHAQGASFFSSRKTPWQLIGFESFPTAQQAKARERSLKQNPRMLKLFRKRMLSRAALRSPRQVVG